MNVGEILREAREAAGLTQKQLATRAGTAQSAISRIEMDHISPTVDTLERLAGHCGAELAVRAVRRGDDWPE